MSKSGKNKNTRVTLSPENYIRKRSRNSPVDKCIINERWNESGRANITVVRRHASGNVTFCGYLVDKCCLGIKNTFFGYNISRQEFDSYIEKCKDTLSMEEISYELAHNIIFAAVEYAEEYGFKPHKDFISTTKYFLEEDNENIPFIDIYCGGAKGRPLYFNNGDETPAQAEKIIRQLEKTAGEGNFDTGTSMDMSEFSKLGEMERREKEEKEFCDAYRKKIRRMSNRSLERETLTVFMKYTKKNYDGNNSEIARKARFLTDFWREKDGMFDSSLSNEYHRLISEDFNSVMTVKTGSLPNSLFPDGTTGREDIEYDFIQVFLQIYIQEPNIDNAEKQLDIFERKYGECGASTYLKRLFNDSFNVDTYSDMEQQFNRFPDYFLIKLMQKEKQIASADKKEIREQLMNLVEGITITRFEYIQFILCYMTNIFEYLNNRTENLIETISALIVFLKDFYMNHSDFTTRLLLDSAKTRLVEATIIKFMMNRYPSKPEQAGQEE